MIEVGTKVRAKHGWTGTVVGIGFVPRGYRTRRMPCAVRVELAETVFVDWGENVLADKLGAWGNRVKVAYAYAMETVKKLEIVERNGNSETGEQVSR